MTSSTFAFVPHCGPVLSLGCASLLLGVDQRTQTASHSTRLHVTDDCIQYIHSLLAAEPAAGATSLIAVMGDKTIIALGYMYVLVPVLSGALILLIVALATNNLSAQRAYPKYWW